jgi:hypothetical protein
VKAWQIVQWQLKKTFGTCFASTTHVPQSQAARIA